MPDFEMYLSEQIKKHPAMTPQDAVKLCYQAAFGAEHLLNDLALAEDYFMKEYKETKARDMDLYEQISPRVLRINLAAWKYRKLPPEWLFRVFVQSAKPLPDGEKRFAEYLETAGKYFTPAQLNSYTPPLHHSAQYRAAESPAYRVAESACIRLLPLLEAAAKADCSKAPCVISIDGRAASGKTTLANQLSHILPADVIRMDHFFLPMKLRTKERLRTPGGNIHYERFSEEVLPYIAQPQAFTYRKFNCGTMALDGTVRVGTHPFRIVEGSYSLHPLFGNYADITVFSDVEERVQMARIMMRNGSKMAEIFRTRWIPLEEEYFSTYKISDKAQTRIISSEIW